MNNFVSLDEGGDTDWKNISISTDSISLGKDQYLDLGGIVK